MTGPEFWEALLASFTVFAAGSLVLQVTMLIVFENDLWVLFNGEKKDPKYRFPFDLKPFVSLGFSLYVVFRYDFDLYARIFAGETSTVTTVLTGIAFSAGAHFIHGVLDAWRKVQEAEAEMRIKKAQNGG